LEFPENVHEYSFKGLVLRSARKHFETVENFRKNANSTSKNSAIVTTVITIGDDDGDDDDGALHAIVALYVIEPISENVV
jgi:hypothetical protein